MPRRRSRERLVEKLGERYEIAQTDIKKWTVGSPIQGPLDGIEAIRRKRPFEADQVKRVTVRLAPSVAKVVDNRDIPDICLQHMIAVMLLDKTVSFHAAHDKPRMQDAAALRERAKVNLVHDEELAKFLPVRVAVVEIELTDGTAARGAGFSRARHAAQPDDARRGDRQGPRSRCAGPGARKVGTADRDGVRDRSRNGHSQLAAAASARLIFYRSLRSRALP